MYLVQGGQPYWAVPFTKGSLVEPSTKYAKIRSLDQSNNTFS
jgi:hypothetical protein